MVHFDRTRKTETLGKPIPNFESARDTPKLFRLSGAVRRLHSGNHRGCGTDPSSPFREGLWRNLPLGNAKRETK